MQEVLRLLGDKRTELQQQLDTVDAAIKLVRGGTATNGTRNGTGNGKTKRVVSAAAKRKMSLAAKKRWAERKKSGK
jgi:hypothetical protein